MGEVFNETSNGIESRRAGTAIKGLQQTDGKITIFDHNIGPIDILSSRSPQFPFRLTNVCL